MLKNIVVADGQTVAVDSDRYSAFDGLRNYPQFMASLTNGGPYTARDAGEAMAFVVSQLAYTEAKTFEKLYTPMQYEKLIPITNEAGEWADSIRYEIYDFAGRGKRYSGKGLDINLVDVAYADKIIPVALGNVGYDYTMEELRRSAFLRKPIAERRMAAAMEAYRRHMNQVGLYGEAISNITGLFNNPNVPQGNAPNGLWLTTNAANPLLILADLNSLITNVWTGTQYNDQVTDIIFPPLRFSMLGSVARSINSDTTLLQFLRANNIAKNERGIDLNFTPGYGLDTAGAGGTARMIGYVKSDQRLIMHIPMPLRFLAPQPLGLSVQVPGEYKYSGVEFRYPKSAYYMDGV